MTVSSDLIGRARGGRKLIAVVYADMVGYSRLIGLDDIGTLERLRSLRQTLIDPTIEEHGGRLVQTGGDSLLIVFDSIDGAVRCAVNVQQQIPSYDGGRLVDRAIRFRVGINIGDVIADGADLHGDGVNIAARLQAECPPGAICVSRAVRDHVHGQLDVVFEELGALSLKNISRPVEAFLLHVGKPEVAPERPEPRYRSGKPAEVPRLSILVALVGNPMTTTDYLAEAVTDDVATDLSRTLGSFVVGRAEALRRIGDGASPRDVARELGLNYVVQVSFRGTAERLGANMQLIDAATGGHLWAERFDLDRGGTDDDRNEIISRWVRTLSLKLTEDVGRRIEALPPAEWTPYDLVMRGRAFSYRPISAANRHAAIRCFEQALEGDPDLVNARIGIASMLVANIADGWSEFVTRDAARAEQLLLEVLGIDGDMCHAHTWMGILRRVQGRLDDSQIELEIAVALVPDNSLAISQLGLTLAYLGQPEVGMPLIERSLRLAPHDPGTPISWTLLGLCQLLLGNIDEAISCLRRSLARNPHINGTHFLLAGALGLKGELDEASISLRHAIALRPELGSLSSLRAMAYHKHPRFSALFEQTAMAGLRRAGMAED